MVATSRSALVKQVLDWTATSSGRAYCFVNVNTVVEASEDTLYKEMLQNNAYNCCDGAPIFWILRLKAPKSLGIVDRTPGPDIFAAIVPNVESDVAQYFIGANEEVLRNLKSEFKLTSPNVEFYSPPFSPQIDVLTKSIEDYLNGKPPGLVWLGLGGKKQDSVAIQLSSSLPFCFIGVGAAFDFSSGVKKRSPKFLSRIGLEWSFRLFTEPRRLSKRYLVGGVKFLKVIWNTEIYRKSSR
jgi:N-acetylglucosaminyldiphosphoundecaprenol N-acetyl-beta-D-mannosaminyltransferase